MRAQRLAQRRTLRTGDDAQRGTRGASSIEYALLIGLMALAIVGAATAVGGATSDGMNAAAEGFPES